MVSNRDLPYIGTPLPARQLIDDPDFIFLLCRFLLPPTQLLTAQDCLSLYNGTYIYRDTFLPMVWFQLIPPVIQYISLNAFAEYSHLTPQTTCLRNDSYLTQSGFNLFSPIRISCYSIVCKHLHCFYPHHLATHHIVRHLFVACGNYAFQVTLSQYKCSTACKINCDYSMGRVPWMQVRFNLASEAALGHAIDYKL